MLNTVTSHTYILGKYIHPIDNPDDRTQITVNDIHLSNQSRPGILISSEDIAILINL